LYDPVSGTWTVTGNLWTRRAAHTATLLPDGRTLLSGGAGSSNLLASAELYNPATGTWTVAGSLGTARYIHTATLLANGKVLTTGGGGNSSNALASTELYDPAQTTTPTPTPTPSNDVGNFRNTGSLTTGRFYHTATLLPNGKVLAAGGWGVSQTTPLASAELYDPASATWAMTSTLGSRRGNHTATMLPSGKVLVAGGYSSGTGNSASAELYDPASAAWASTGSLNSARSRHTATLLSNGKVLVVGGLSGGSSSTSLASAELYDPASGTWTVTGSLAAARYYHAATLLPNGKVLVTGGDNVLSAEVYDPASGTWTGTQPLPGVRAVHTATLLPNGNVLITGGSYSPGFGGALASSELYVPASGTWTAAGNLGAARYRHTATLLTNGRVLAPGGLDNSSTLASAEVYDPAGGSWRATGGLGAARQLHTATLLPNGEVLVAGGYGGSGAGGPLTSTELYLTVPPTRLGNISTRLRVETGDNVLIAGFIVGGTQPKKIIVRAIGPSLPLTGPLADPILELRDSSGGLIASNDNWRSDQAAEIITAGLPPANDLESAIVATLPGNGAYTAIVRGVNNGTGMGVVEAYDLDGAVDSRLANISTRGLVQTGDNVLIAGTIVLGEVSQRVLIRAIGPSLNLAGKLADPTLEFRDGNGGLILSNDNWRSNQEAEIMATMIPPSNDLESAIVASLPAGGAAYTAIVRGANGATGVAVVEVYALD
jgi:N-acetylneuraminic acid mutarotase